MVSKIIMSLKVEIMQENAEDFINADRNRVAVENDIRLPDVACSEGWRSLWTVHNGTWNLA